MKCHIKHIICALAKDVIISKVVAEYRKPWRLGDAAPHTSLVLTQRLTAPYEGARLSR